MSGITEEMRGKLAKIKLLLTDVDGVLTDGGMYYTENGLTMKKFNVKDGMGSYILRMKGFEVGIITSDAAPIGQIRAARLGFDYNYNGVHDKRAVVDEICSTKGYDYENIAFIGDDVNDIPLLKIAGFSACPADAHKSVKRVAGYISDLKGGEGILREICDMILEVNGFNYEEEIDMKKIRK